MLALLAQVCRNARAREHRLDLRKDSNSRKTSAARVQAQERSHPRAQLMLDSAGRLDPSLAQEMQPSLKDPVEKGMRLVVISRHVVQACPAVLGIEMATARPPSSIHPRHSISRA